MCTTRCWPYPELKKIGLKAVVLVLLKFMELIEKKSYVCQKTVKFSCNLFEEGVMILIFSYFMMFLLFVIIIILIAI